MERIIDTDASSPFGTFAPTGAQRALIGYARLLQHSRATLKMALSVKKPLLSLTKAPIDHHAFGINIRFYPHDNFCERRVLTVPTRWDPAERTALLSHLKPGGTFIDIGANAGMYSLIMAQAVGPSGTVLSFEPQKRVYDRLQFNKTTNGFDQMRLKFMGVSDQQDELILYQPTNNRGEASMVRSFEGAEETRVPVRPLLDVLKEENITQIDALKIDIEGHEDRAMAPFISGADASLLPKVIVTENSQTDWAVNWIDLALERGYRISHQSEKDTILER